MLFDDIFEENVGKMIALLDPVCELLNKVQATSTPIANGVNLWLSLKLPEDQTLKPFFKKRITQHLNIYGLTAYYLHPYYDRKLLSAEHLVDITDLFSYLDGDALQELDLLLNQKFYFGVLLAKNFKKDADLSWRIASLKYPNLAKTAAKLLSISASSAQIETFFKLVLYTFRYS